MGLLDFCRRKFFSKRVSTAPRLKEIWSGFQQILASNNETQGIIGNLEEMLASQKDPDLPFLNSRVWVLDQHFAGLGCATCARVEAIAAAAADASAARQQLQALAQAQLPPISATHYLYTGAPLTRRASLGTPARPPRWSLAISGPMPRRTSA